MVLLSGRAQTAHGEFTPEDKKTPTFVTPSTKGDPFTGKKGRPALPHLVQKHLQNLMKKVDLLLSLAQSNKEIIHQHKQKRLNTKPTTTQTNYFMTSQQKM